MRRVQGAEEALAQVKQGNDLVSTAVSCLVCLRLLAFRIKASGFRIWGQVVCVYLPAPVPFHSDPHTHAHTPCILLSRYAPIGGWLCDAYVRTFL